MDDCTQNQATARPFLAAPEPNRYYPATSIEEARKKIFRTIGRGEGPALLIGASGTGKTLLLEVFARQFEANLEVVFLAGAQLCTRRALLQSILFQLNLPYRDLDEGELRLSLVDYLKPRMGKNHRLLLLVDEADSLATRLLEELRALSNLSAHGELLVNLVLAGNTGLEERFTDPELDVFSQRIAQRSYLSPFGREETFHYIRAQIAASDCSADLFSQDALEAVYSATDGIPRLINQLCDQLVWLSQETGYSPLDAEIVQQAWAELQQLPAPWNLESRRQAAIQRQVEFGELPTLDGDDNLDECDEMPALLPISFGRHREVPSLVDEEPRAHSPLVEEDAQEFESEAQDIEFDFADAATVRNPFGDFFEHEELVFDKYLEFEVQMLAGAPRVINRLDSAFAQQLKNLESQLGDQSVVHSHDLPSAALENSYAPAQGENTACETVCIQELGLGNLTNPEEEFDSQDEEADFYRVATQSEQPAGNILLIEDDRSRSMAIVSGRNFRRLFSSLETGS